MVDYNKIYVPVSDSTLAKLTAEEKKNLQASLDSYEKAGYERGYDEGYDEAMEGFPEYY
jgi:hypothetical protein